MNIAMGNSPQITEAPRCPECGSTVTSARRSQGIELDHKGKRCRAQKQYRQCRQCGHNFPVIHIKGEVSRDRRRKIRESLPSLGI